MFQRRPSRTVTRNRSLVLGGALAALAVVGGGTVVAVNSPAEVEADGIQLTQNTAGQAGQAAAQEMPLGTAVNLDLEPVVARAAGGTIPPGTTVKVTGLPDGLTQDGWVISGTPTRVGEYDVLVTVSNAGVSRSQRVTIAVTDEADGATSPARATSPAAGADQDPSTSNQSGTSDQSDQSDEEDSTDESEPTLSSVPGDPSRADATTTADGGGAGDGASGGTDDSGAGGIGDEDDSTPGDGDDDDDNNAGDGVDAGSDLCALLEGGQSDSGSVEMLLPLLTGDDSAATGFAAVVVNALVGLLPSVLGEDGLFGDLGSGSEMLCTLAPSLLGGLGGATGADATGAGADGAGAAATAGAGTAGADALPSTTQLEGAATGLPVSPTVLLGLLNSGTGSAGN